MAMGSTPIASTIHMLWQEPYLFRLERIWFFLRMENLCFIYENNNNLETENISTASGLTLRFGKILINSLIFLEFSFYYLLNFIKKFIDERDE